MTQQDDIQLSDYLLDQEGYAWGELLAPYTPPLPSSFTLFIATRFLDFFLTYQDGSIHWLDTSGVSITKVAGSRSEFEARIETEYANWLSVPLVDEAVARGLILGPGQCYSFKIPPFLGGAYEIDNVEVSDLDVALTLLGQLFQQTKDLPDGTPITVRTE